MTCGRVGRARWPTGSAARDRVDSLRGRDAARAGGDDDAGRARLSPRRRLRGRHALLAGDVELTRGICGPETVIYNVYGSTEAGHVSSFEIPSDLSLAEGTVPVGEPDPAVEVRIVDDDDEPVARGEPGRIVVVRHNWLALGYWDDPELTRERLLPRARRETRLPYRRLGPLARRRHARARRPDRLTVKVHGAIGVDERSRSDTDHASRRRRRRGRLGTRPVRLAVGRVRRPARRRRPRRVEVAPRPLAASLSSTSVPSAFVAVESLPRTIRSKVDRAALAAAARPARRYSASRRATNATSPRSSPRCSGSTAWGSTTTSSSSAATRSAWSSCSPRSPTGSRSTCPASTVLEAPTVAELAFAALAPPPTRDASPVVALHAVADGPTFFCVTGGGTPAISLARAERDDARRELLRRAATWARRARAAGPQRVGRGRAVAYCSASAPCSRGAVTRDRRLLVRGPRGVRDRMPTPRCRRGGRAARRAHTPAPRYRARPARCKPSRAAPAGPRRDPLRFGAARRHRALARVRRGATIARRAVRVVTRSVVAAYGTAVDPHDCRAAAAPRVPPVRTSSCGSARTRRTGTTRPRHSTARCSSCAVAPAAGRPPIWVGRASSLVRSRPSTCPATTSGSYAGRRVPSGAGPAVARPALG